MDKECRWADFLSVFDNILVLPVGGFWLAKLGARVVRSSTPSGAPEAPQEFVGSRILYPYRIPSALQSARMSETVFP